MYYGLDAMLHGAVAALVALLPAVALFWRLTRGLAGPRPQRPFVTVSAAYGIAVGAASLWAANFERSAFVDEAMGGAMIFGALAAFVVFLILLLFPRKA
jgi:hypothetical protein